MYTHDPQTVAVGVQLLAVAAVFQVFDGIQGIGTGALRGLGKTRGPMVINMVAYGVIGLPIGYFYVSTRAGHLWPVDRLDAGAHLCCRAGAHHVVEAVEAGLIQFCHLKG